MKFKSNEFSVSFDGAFNFDGEIKGVQALLNQDNPDIKYIHCRAHLLQLTIVHARKLNKYINRVINTCAKLY